MIPITIRLLRWFAKLIRWTWLEEKALWYYQYYKDKNSEGDKL